MLKPKVKVGKQKYTKYIFANFLEATIYGIYHLWHQNRSGDLQNIPLDKRKLLQQFLKGIKQT